jgi:5-methyltetrahydrofolate--homocysteine methyltransferase
VTSRLLDALAVRPLLLDGGMGTRLIARGLDLSSDAPVLWNLSHPDEVSEIHRRDVAAGSDAVLSNTFGADTVSLDRETWDLSAINRRAVELARDVVGADRFILGSISPRASHSETAYAAQAEALAEAGADALFLETHTPDEALVGLHQLRHCFPLPIVVGVFTGMGEDELRELVDRGADVVGMNCRDPSEVQAWAEDRVPVRDASGRRIPFLSEPSASHPDYGDVPPAQFAAIIPGLLRRGFRLFGGCCGATEAHVAAMRSALDRATRLGV